MIDELNDTYLLVIKSMTPYKYDYKNHKDVNEINTLKVLKFFFP